MEEFQRIYCKFFPDGNAAQFAEQVFKSFDSNCDGAINFREFLCTISVMRLVILFTCTLIGLFAYLLNCLIA